MMGVDSYKAILLCEATRFYEEDQQDAPLNSQAHDQQHGQKHAESLAIEKGGSFDQRLYQRATHLDSAAAIQQGLDNLLKKQRQLILFFSLVIFICGYFFSKTLLLTQNDLGANVYVIFIALVLPNLFSLLVFYYFYWRSPTLDGANLFSAIKLLLSKIVRTKKLTPSDKKNTKHVEIDPKQITQACFKAWQNLHLKGALAKPLLAFYNHNLWLAFLIGALFALLVRLSAHHYYFGWESTLLPHQFFINLTNILSAPMHYLNIAAPNFELVTQSNLKSNFDQDLYGSQRWSFFLIAALIMYALIPRAISSLVFYIKTISAQKNLSLDTHQLAYAKLYQSLMLSPADTKIVDHDDFSANDTSNSAQAKAKKDNKNTTITNASFNSAALNPQLPFLAIELAFDSAQQLNKQFAKAPFYLGHASDRNSQKDILASAQQTAGDQLLIILSLLSVTERGISRYIKQLKAIKKNLIVVMVDQDLAQQRLNSDEFSQRLFDWRMTLNKLGIEQENIAISDLSQQEIFKRLVNDNE